MAITTFDPVKDRDGDSALKSNEQNVTMTWSDKKLEEMFGTRTLDNPELEDNRATSENEVNRNPFTDFNANPTDQKAMLARNAGSNANNRGLNSIEAKHRAEERDNDNAQRRLLFTQLGLSVAATLTLNNMYENMVALRDARQERDAAAQEADAQLNNLEQAQASGNSAEIAAAQIAAAESVAQSIASESAIDQLNSDFLQHVNTLSDELAAGDIAKADTLKNEISTYFLSSPEERDISTLSEDAQMAVGALEEQYGSGDFVTSNECAIPQGVDRAMSLGVDVYAMPTDAPLTAGIPQQTAMSAQLAGAEAAVAVEDRLHLEVLDREARIVTDIQNFSTEYAPNNIMVANQIQGEMLGYLVLPSSERDINSLSVESQEILAKLEDQYGTDLPQIESGKLDSQYGVLLQSTPTDNRLELNSYLNRLDGGNRLEASSGTDIRSTTTIASQMGFDNNNGAIRLGHFSPAVVGQQSTPGMQPNFTPAPGMQQTQASYGDPYKTMLDRALTGPQMAIGVM